MTRRLLGCDENMQKRGAYFEREIFCLNQRPSAQERQIHALQAGASRRGDALEKHNNGLDAHGEPRDKHADAAGKGEHVASGPSDDVLVEASRAAYNHDHDQAVDELQDCVCELGNQVHAMNAIMKDNCSNLGGLLSTVKLLLPKREEKQLSEEEAVEAVHELVTFFIHQLADTAANMWNLEGRKPYVSRSRKRMPKWHEYLDLTRYDSTPEVAEAFDRGMDRVCVLCYKISIQERDRLSAFLREGSKVTQHSYTGRQTRNCIEHLRSVTPQDKELLYALADGVVRG